MSEKDEIKKEGLFQGGDTTVTITCDDGSEIECVVLTIFIAGDMEYIALLPEEENENGESDVYLYRYTETADGQPDLTNIESDEEYELVADAFDEILDEQELNELLEDDPEE